MIRNLEIFSPSMVILIFPHLFKFLSRKWKISDLHHLFVSSGGACIPISATGGSRQPANKIPWDCQDTEYLWKRLRKLFSWLNSSQTTSLSGHLWLQQQILSKTRKCHTERAFNDLLHKQAVCWVGIPDSLICGTEVWAFICIHLNGNRLMAGHIELTTFHKEWRSRPAKEHYLC